MKHVFLKDFYWLVPLSAFLGAGLSALQSGNRLIGFAGFAFLSFICLFLLTSCVNWAGRTKILAWMVALAFALRFAGGVGTYLLLPVNGFEDADDKAGFVYTDAHRRDAQAWQLADSGNSLFGGFNQSYAYDQYGGLLTFSAFVYRFLSPDAHRPLMLVLLSAFMAALGLPFLWGALQVWDARIAIPAGWVYALYPESVLLGGSAMREPYLMAFSAFALWGFVHWQSSHEKKSLLWLAAGILGMILVSPVAALMTLLILGGWLFFERSRRKIPWWVIAAALIVFTAALLFLSSSLNRQGQLGSGTPFAVINNFIREAVKWDVYQLQRGSGWVQKLFDEMPGWMRLPFVMIYGLFQPVLPAALVEPTTLTWRVIGLLRAFGWYALLPALILSFMAAAGQRSAQRRVWLWLALISWGWILFAALRGGGDQWDNPRYRMILFVWQAILAGGVWVWWRETRSVWPTHVLMMEAVFVLVFGQWYVNRYFRVGSQLPFEKMILLISGLWAAIFVWGWRRGRNRHSV